MRSGAYSEHRDPKTYSRKKQRLKSIQRAWGARLDVAAGRVNQATGHPVSTLSYGRIVAEYTFARRMSRWWRGLEYEKPKRD